ncbi:MAG TPA: asparagine synthase (glutamine-hydrolyzing) [Vicinamibacteria bacterium]|jgi:asparagine synthase (glutamine-hydrolysing)|nr:asparagine synthase (glutamine-hydrolyzing) [Vicinamibacteria bacterium]
MCGVAGAIRRILDGREAAARPRSEKIVGFVERISEAQRHRGPDGSGLWESRDREIVFAHRRLAILDLSEAGAQPMVDDDSGCAITFNGEVYNFAEIRRELEAGGEIFRSSCDTEVILKAHKRWGIDAVKRFRGIFALALWDPRARAVHLVRDPLGIKPLYWTIFRDPDTGEEVTLFASEVRALLACGAIPRRLEPAAVASYLWHGFVVGPDTIVEGVHLLPAATILTIEAGDLTHRQNSRKARRYWDMPSSADGKTTVAELREELMNTVKMQLVADVPLGVFLSGGIDSSAVAALASEVVPDSVHTFTIGFEAAAYDETHYAQLVAEGIRSRHTSITLTEQSFQEQLPDAFNAIDQPTFDGINTYFVSRAARGAGMTVALAGTGGDEMFGGYASFVDIPKGLRAGAWLPGADDAGIVRRTVDSTVTLGARFVNEMSWNLLKVAPPQTRWGKVADVARAAREALGLYQVSYALFTRETQGILAGSAVRRAQGQLQHGLPPEVAAAWRQRIGGSDVLHSISLLEISSFVGERLLRDTDAASMAVALEVRVPLLDHILAETVARVDPIRRFSPPRKKQLLREVALGKLDPAIFDRPKSGFVLPIDTWARQRLRPQMETVFADDGLARRVGLRGEAVQTLWRSFAGGRSGLYWSRIWALYVLLSWCQTHDLSLPA